MSICPSIISSTKLLIYYLLCSLIYSSVHPSIHPSVHLSIVPSSIYLSIQPPSHALTHQPTYPSIHPHTLTWLHHLKTVPLSFLSLSKSEVCFQSNRLYKEPSTHSGAPRNVFSDHVSVHPWRHQRRLCCPGWHSSSSPGAYKSPSTSRPHAYPSQLHCSRQLLCSCVCLPREEERMGPTLL